jgi:peptidoglycan/LPS O-acetylase OafA/YrhL
MSDRLVTRTVSTVTTGDSVAGLRRASIGYNPGLDGLRAVSIVAVIAGHAGLYVPGGYHGVTVFFVISGYLITSLLATEFERTTRINFGHFYWRRFARLAPALIVVVVLTSVFLLATGMAFAEWWAGAVGSLTYSTDLMSAWWPGAPISTAFQYTWSLGIEEQFYLIWPFLLFLLLRWGKFVPAMALIALGVAGTWVYRIVAYHDGVSGAAFTFGPFTHTDALLLGCAAALILRRFPDSVWLRRVAAVLGFFAIFGLAHVILAIHGGLWPGFAIPHLPDAFSFGQAAIAAFFVVFWVAASPRSWFARVMAFRPIAYLGKLSYSLYLWNILLTLAFIALVGVDPVKSRWGIVWLIALIGVSYVSYRYIETPLRKRWAPPQAHAVMGQAGLVEVPSAGGESK